MSKPEKMVPEVRFKGFTEDWEQRKLGEIANFSKGSGYSKRDLMDSGTPIVLYGRLYTKYETIINDINTFSAIKKNTVLSAGEEVIVPASGESAEDIARASVIDVSGIILGGDLNIIQLRESVEPVFLALIISYGKQRKELVKRAQGNSVVHLYNSSLKKINLLFPNKEEQIKIGLFFKKIDDTIALHQRKLDALKRLKQGYLESMFPEKGEIVPRLRFANFSGGWEQCKLEECFDERNDRTSEGDLISVTINSGVVKTNSLERKNNSSINKYNYKKVVKGDIAYNSMRMWQGASGLSNYTGILSPAYTVLIPNSSVSALFFSYLFKLPKMIYTFQANSQGLTSDTWNLKYPILKNIKVQIPTYEEQLKIGCFLQKHDINIRQQEIKLTKLYSIKNVFLQNIFI